LKPKCPQVCPRPQQQHTQIFNLAVTWSLCGSARQCCWTVCRNLTWQSTVNRMSYSQCRWCCDLGAYLDSELSMRAHISKIAHKCFFHLLSQIDYSNGLLAGLPYTTIAPLRRSYGIIMPKQKHGSSRGWTTWNIMPSQHHGGGQKHKYTSFKANNFLLLHSHDFLFYKFASTTTSSHSLFTVHSAHSCCKPVMTQLCYLVSNI